MKARRSILTAAALCVSLCALPAVAQQSPNLDHAVRNYAHRKNVRMHRWAHRKRAHFHNWAHRKRAHMKQWLDRH